MNECKSVVLMFVWRLHAILKSGSMMDLGYKGYEPVFVRELRCACITPHFELQSLPIFQCLVRPMFSVMNMPRFGDMNPRYFCAKQNNAPIRSGMPRFGDMNPRYFCAKQNNAPISSGMPRFGDMNPRSFCAKQNNDPISSGLPKSDLCLLLIPICSQNVSGVFDWRGRSFHQAQPQIATLLLQTASQRSKGHNHRLLSALLHGSIGTAGVRMAAVFRDQDFLATSSEEMDAALQAFRTVTHTSVAPSTQGEVLDISEDQMIALCDQIFTLSDRLKNIVNDEYLAQITESSLKVLQKRHVQWTVARNLQQSQSTVSPRPRTPPPARVTRPAVPSVPRDAGGRFRARSAEELDAYSFAAARDALEQLDPSVSPVSGGNLSGVNREFLLSVAGLYPVPVLGGWGDSLVFRSPSLRTKAITELQQMDAVFDSTLFDIIERNSLYVQKAHLVTLKWHEVVPIGRATALWALLSLSLRPLQLILYVLVG